MPWRGHRAEHRCDSCKRHRKRQGSPALDTLARSKGGTGAKGKGYRPPQDDGGWNPYEDGAA